MRALSRILMTSLTLALAVPVLSATLGCSDCEDYCQRDYGDCDSSSATEDSARCKSELNRCLQSCASEPTDWDELAGSLGSDQ